MSPTEAISRRVVLTSLARFGVGGTLWVMLSGCRRGGVPEDPQALELLGLFSDPAAVRRIGEAILNEREDWRANDSLLEQLFAHPQWGGNQEPGRILLDRIRDDLRRGRIVLADAWVFAETEARLFALAALAW